MKRDAGLCQCSECASHGLVTLAHEVDHIVSKALWRLMYGRLDGVDDDTNLQAINRECHKRKTAQDRAAVQAWRAGQRPPQG